MARRTAYGGVLALLAFVVPAAGAATTTAPPLPDPIDLGGTRVEVSTDLRAPTLLGAGLWADTLGGPGNDVHLFRYNRTIEYSAVLVGVVATSVEEYADAISVTVTAPDGSACGNDSSTSGSSTPQSAYGALVLASDEPGERDDPCIAADHLDIEVTRGTSEATSDLPIAIRLVEEAPVTGTPEDLPPVQEDPTAPQPETAASAEPVTGGSFADAPELAPGVTVGDEVPEGVERLYRVRLDWGQALAVRVDVPPQDAAVTEALDAATDPTLTLTLIDPLRNTFDGGAEAADDSATYAEEPATMFDATRPVAYLNRFDDGLVSVPGDYWVSVSVSPAGPDRDPVDVPVEITVDVVGEPGEPPGFQGNVVGPGGQSAAPQGYDLSTPYLVDAGVFRADVAGQPAAGDASDARGSGAATVDDDTRRAVGLIVGGLGLVVCAAGLLLLSRRRRAG